MRLQNALIIGCGKIGRTYVEALMELRIKISGVADVVSERAENLAEIAKAKAYTDYKQMLKDNEDGIVCISTPTPFHKEAMLTAADSGFDIFCEKPVATTFSEAKEMIDAAETNGIELGIGFKMRYECVFAEVKRYLNEGKLGKVQHVYINFFQPLPDVDWYLDEGIITGLLVHAMDLTNWFLVSSPKSVKADAYYFQERKGEDQAFLEYSYDNGHKAVISGGYVERFPQIAGDEDLVFELVCEKGYIIGRRPNFLLIRDQKETINKIIKPINAFKQELKVFFDAIAEGNKPPVGGKEGLKAQAMIDAALESINNKGLSVKIDV